METAILLGAALIVSSVWFSHCNDRTSKQRATLIRCTTQEPGSIYYWPGDTYNRHLWRLFFVRDPWAIYPIGFRRLAYRNKLTKVDPDA
jgi:hypothetical protein